MRTVVPSPECRAHLDVPAVLLDDPEHHRQTQAGATFTFGGKERLEHACLDLSAHAHARIDHLNDALAVLSLNSQADRPTRGQRVDRIEDEIGHEFAQPSGGALNGWIPLRLDVQTYVPSFGLRRVTPAGSSQLRRVAHHAA